jgi:starvation-inducible DNA-binding protein
MTNKIDALQEVLANSYSLYLKTQNYHWNVEGPDFYSLHKFFEEQYLDLATAVDLIAERIRFLGAKANASFSAYNMLSSIKEASGKEDAKTMVTTLLADQEKIIKILDDTIKTFEGDEATIDILIGRLEIHQKHLWMFKSLTK